MKHNSDIKIAFFGTPDIAVWVLEELERASMLPVLIITNPDMPQGRKMLLTPPPVKVWAEARGIEVVQPHSLKDNSEMVTLLNARGITLSIVAAYGKIIPKTILGIPQFGTLNVHPSLLPRFRGASPIRSAILEDARETGVTIMLMDEDLDHGPILAQEKTDIEESVWPIGGKVLDERMARQGGALLAETIPKWIAGTITPQEQNHASATFCTKISKEIGEINLGDDPYKNLLKIRAFEGWPGTFFFHEKGGKRLRVKIIDAHIENNALTITRIIPEGKNEMDFEVFMKG